MNSLKIRKMHLLDETDERRRDENSQVVPTDLSCCLELSDSTSTDRTPESDTKTGESGHANFWKRYRIFLLTGTVFVVLIVLLLRLVLPITLAYNIYNIDTPDRVEPKEHAGRVVEQGYPTDGASFDDEIVFTGRVTRGAENNTHPRRDVENGGKRARREISRDRRDCDVSAARCQELMRSMRGYLERLGEKSTAEDPASPYEDILKCLRCESLKSMASDALGKSAPRPNDRYFSAARNRSGEPAITVIELLDENGTRNGKHSGENSTGYDGAGGTEAATKISTAESIASETTVAIDSAIDSGVNATMYTRGSDINVDPTTSVGDVIKAESNGSVSVTPNVEERRAIAKSKLASSGAATLQLSTTATSIETSRGIISMDSTTSETSTRNYEIDLAERIAISEDTTKGEVAQDVTGIGNGDNAAARPSHDGHPENRSATATNEPRAVPDYLPFGQGVMRQDRFDAKNRDKPGEYSESTGESTKAFQTMQMTPMMSWTMPQPVCFHASPGQFPNRQSPAGSTFYPGFPGTSFSPTNRGPPFPNPPSHRGTDGSSQPSYVQVQAQSVQFMPRLNYPGNPGQSQPTGSGVGPTGPGIPSFPFNQPPTAATGGSNPNAPIFCTYVSMPTLRFPPVSGATQLARSDKAENNPPGEPSKPLDKDWPINWMYSSGYPNTCPLDSRRCASDGYCVLKVKWCDGRVDCTDASDETMCSCRDRISRDRLCDGYFDCPHGEDELGCFDCPEDSFSCDDWDRRHSRENCVPLPQRCDGIEQCRNGKDETDCNILSASYIDGKDIFTIGYTQGYLHKNIRGQWYPVCSSEVFWALDACASETGQSLTAMPEIQVVRLPEGVFQGPYVKESRGRLQFVASCSDSAMFVKCPPIPCGTRVLPREGSSPLASGTMGDYPRKRYARAQRAALAEDAGFADNYREMLGLLDEGRLDLDEKQEDRNDTVVGTQVRVVGGRTSQPRAWPFLVAIYKDGNFHCGGVILNEIWILTAAHCMEDYETHYYEVQAGMLRRFSFSPMAQSRKARNIVIHTEYRSQDMQNDIAIITLDEPFLFNRWIRQVCLPAASTAGPGWKRGPTPQSTCVAIGWGATRERGPDPDHLREVEVPILPSCKYPTDRNDATICAGYSQGGRDACQGDSGGPLMCRNPYLESQWYVAGVISHGDGCARPNEPGVYTKVGYFARWIQESTERSPIPSNGGALLASCPGFSCQTGLGNCLPIEKHCDGIVDCLEAEDEIGCVPQSGYGQYRQSDGEFVGKVADEASNVTVENQTSTEAAIISTLYERQKQAGDHRESSNATTVDMTMSAATSVRLTFTCTSLIQTITIDKRCDRRLDCEDGTDELGCTCRDRLLNLQPTAICDGHLDCDDETDEKNCGICREDEFYCGRSVTCVPMTKRCDAIFDCPLREDEIDCLALTDGDHVNVDSDKRPVLNMEGLLSRYVNGTWRTECLQTGTHDNDAVMTTIGANTCRYLGFANARSVDKVAVDRTELETRSWREGWENATGHESSRGGAAGETGDGTCSAIRIRCRPVLSGSAESHLVVDPRTGSQSYLWPWLAAIFVDGRYRCTALLLEPDWLLSGSRCTEDIRLSVNYTTALLGQSRSYLYVDGPYQQISAVDEIRNVKHSDVSLLHLRTAANFTHHVLPLFSERRIYPPGRNDLCVAIGTDEEHVTQSIFLQPILQDCDKCHRCFVETSGLVCPANATSSSWSGTVFCHSQRGWYPAAVFHENDGPCGFRAPRNLTSIDYIHAHLTQALEEEARPTAEPTCDGVRCDIGGCVSRDRVCDGVTDCRDGGDERTEMCNETRFYSNDVSRECAKSELRCGNGECVPKSVFCDGKVDCLDGTDEPVRCTCAEYLRLTAPKRLCDGVRHCYDKTDESPDVCRGCTVTSFKCDDTESGNVTCVPRDFVCDGDQDCGNGEDEKRCRKLRGSTGDGSAAGEVMQRSYGVWHSRCFSAPVTSPEEARTACEKIGYANGTVDRDNRVSSEPFVPSRDDFHMIRLNLETWITMRDDKPLVTLVRPEEPCYRLFVKCAS